MTFVRSKRVNVTFRPKHCKSFNFATALLLASVLLLASHLAQASNLDKLIAFDIAPTTLDKALLAFGAREHLQIMLEWNSSTVLLPTRQLKGSYTGKQALAEFLQGTRLTYIERGHTLEILPRTSGDSSSTGQARKPSGAQSGPDPQSSNHPAPGISDPPATTRHTQNGLQPPTLGEVMVTAQKYSQRAFDVPISLQAISGAELIEHGVTDLSNLQYDVPGLYMNSSGYSKSVYIRGVSNDSGNGALVGQYIDEADITAEGTSGQNGMATGDVALYDLNRVEVLKGPQGTLYGDGSMGGVIRYITNSPVLDRFELNANAAAMFTEYGAPSQRIQTMLNTPIVDGSLGLRFAGMFEHDGGWVDEPAADLKNINDSNVSDVRAEALWRPVAHLKVTAMQIVHRDASGLGMGENASGSITPLFSTTLVPNQTDSSSISNVTLSYDFAAFRLLSSSTYLSEAQHIYNLMNALPIDYLTFWTLYPHYNSQNKGASEELRLVRSGRGPWLWEIGGFYKHFRNDLFYSDYSGLSGSTLSTALLSPLFPFGGTSNSLAAFANTSYRVFDRVTVGAGVRYYVDRETSFPGSLAARFTSSDPRYYVQYRATQQVNVYASASKGFRSGGFNHALSEPPYGPESVWSYDLGTKIRLPEQDLRADVDFFDMNYSNYVSLTYVPPVYEGVNVGKAGIKGVDAHLAWLPDGLWKFSVNAELLNAKFLTASAASGYAAGDQLPFAPRYSFTASVARSFDLENKRGDAEIYYYEVSRVEDRTLGLPLEQSDIERFLNLRAQIAWNENVKLGVFVHNILNSRGDESPWGLLGESIRPRPRTFGIDIDARFR